MLCKDCKRESIFSFHYVGPRNQTYIVRLGGGLFYQLSDHTTLKPNSRNQNLLSHSIPSKGPLTYTQPGKENQNTHGELQCPGEGFWMQWFYSNFTMYMRLSSKQQFLTC